jgi:hypothetical protein
MTQAPTPKLNINDIDLDFSGNEQDSLNPANANHIGPYSSPPAHLDKAGRSPDPTKPARATEQSAKYHVDVFASNTAPSAGIVKVIEMMNSAIKPSTKK